MTDVSAEDGWEAIGGFQFGDSAAMADRLLSLVLNGSKTATIWAAREGQKVRVGWHLTVRDGRGYDRALIRISELERQRFDAVDARFAFDEGEDDRSLRGWRDAHLAYFERNGGFDPDMEVWCCRFVLLDQR